MAAWSQVLHCSCYELGHTWTPYCYQASLDVAASCIYNCILKIYGPLYLITAILRRKNKEYYLKKLLPEILQSSLFLSTNGTLFMSAFCFWKMVFGKFTKWRTVYLPAFTASISAIFIERKSRRGMLAVYMATVAVESIYRMLESRGIIYPIKNGEVWLFSVVVAVYMYLFRCPNGLKADISSGIRFIVGTSEQPNIAGTVPVQYSSQMNQKDHLKLLLAYLPRNFQDRVKSWRSGSKHRLCKHENSCIASIIEQGLKMFGFGYSIKAMIKLIGSIPVILRGHYRAILKALVHPDNLSLGAFLASFSMIFKSVNCLLRWTRNCDTELHGLLAGFLSGWSMMFYKSSTVALYMSSKLAEILYFKGIAMGSLPHLQWADTLLYAISTAMVFHVAVFEIHNLQPSYSRFILKLTSNRFGLMNRNLLDVFGTQASKGLNYQPKYDPRFSKLAN